MNAECFLGDCVTGAGHPLFGKLGGSVSLLAKGSLGSVSVNVACSERVFGVVKKARKTLH